MLDWRRISRQEVPDKIRIMTQWHRELGARQHRMLAAKAVSELNKILEQQGIELQRTGMPMSEEQLAVLSDEIKGHFKGKPWNEKVYRQAARAVIVVYKKRGIFSGEDLSKIKPAIVEQSASTAPQSPHAQILPGGRR